MIKSGHFPRSNSQTLAFHSKFQTSLLTWDKGWILLVLQYWVAQAMGHNHPWSSVALETTLHSSGLSHGTGELLVGLK